jgi:hypothetical protein
MFQILLFEHTENCACMKKTFYVFLLCVGFCAAPAAFLFGMTLCQFQEEHVFWDGGSALLVAQTESLG